MRASLSGQLCYGCHMRRSIQLVAVALSLSFATAAFAANERRIKPNDYQEMSDEEKAAAKTRARSKITAWNETAVPPEYEFPWMPITFSVLALGLAAPFAWRAWKAYSSETREAAAAANPAPSAPRRPRTKTAE